MLLDRDTLDFDEFCRRVFDIVKSKKSPSPEPKSRMQTPIIRYSQRDAQALLWDLD